jgi:thymidylate synthase (FAD)
MRIIKPSVEILSNFNGKEILKMIEKCGRVCYKSEDKITENSAEKFVQMLINRNHLAMLEHYNLTVKVICDRGVTHEIVRHRIASYAQESTRYVDYNKRGMEFIIPSHFDLNTGIYDFGYANEHIYFGESSDSQQPITNCNQKDWGTSKILWLRHMLWSEKTYNTMINQGQKPQEARSVLPNSLKTEIVITMNLREWLHFFKLRTDKAAHPDMQVVAKLILEEFRKTISVIFDNI